MNTLKRLIKTANVGEFTKEIRYISVGSEGRTICGSRIVDKNIKLSALINLINSDVSSTLGC